jgi:predicted RNase H-like nuclease (RuvC/YqgF family)
MNDEIKEYLDSANFKFKDVDEDGNEIELTLSEAIENLIDNNKQLADCITNLQQEKEDYKSRCEKASDKLGNYKHYSMPTEEQNSENEDIVDSALNILQNGSDDNERL